MKILIVEDETRLLYQLAKILAEEGYEVETAEDGEEGYARAEANSYEAIILDIMLPRLNGWDFLERLRAAGKKTPVLILSALNAAPERVRGLDAGADDYLSKPFDLSELRARLRALLRRSKKVQPTPAVVVGDLVIDTRSLSVTLHGDEVSLTPSEYSILAYLALRRGRVVTRTELCEHIYDDENDASRSNVLDAHVSSLRGKLGAELIKTRRGQGFVIP